MVAGGFHPGRRPGVRGADPAARGRAPRRCGRRPRRRDGRGAGGTSRRRAWRPPGGGRRPHVGPARRGARPRRRPVVRARGSGRTAVPRCGIRHGRRLPRVRAHRGGRRGRRRGGPRPAAGRSFPAVHEPPAAAGAGVGMDRRPGARGAVLAHRAVPRRGRLHGGARPRRGDPVRTPPPVALCERHGERRDARAPHGGATAARGLPRARPRVQRRSNHPAPAVHAGREGRCRHPALANRSHGRSRST